LLDSIQAETLSTDKSNLHASASIPVRRFQSFASKPDVKMSVFLPRLNFYFMMSKCSYSQARK